MISSSKTKFLWTLVILVFSILSCEKEDDNVIIAEDTEPGAVFVTVAYFGRTVAGAEITTNPPTQTVFTSGVGSVMIKDLEPGIYQICATHPDIGSGAASANVKSGEVIDVLINLIGGVFEAPLVSFVSPADNSTFSLGQEIEFVVNVSDNEDGPEALTIEWTSDLDGVFSTQGADENGTSRVAISSLSEGTHQIRVVATDSENNTGSAEITVNVKRLPNAVVLDTIQTDVSGLVLNWSVSDEPEFVSYRVYRSQGGSFELINIINDINTVTYTDNNIQFGVTYSYRIGVLIANGDESLSNVESRAFFGEYIDVSTQVEALMVDPVRPYIYALDRVNNSMLFIHKENRTVEKTIFVGSAPTDMDLHANGDELFIANFGSTEIAVVDLNVQEVSRSIFVNTDVGIWGGNPYRLALMEGDRLVFTSEDQWNDLKLVDANTGALIQATGSLYQPGLVTNPEGTVLYVSESGSTGSQVIRYNLVNDQLNQVDASTSRTNFSTRDAIMSGDGKYLFYNRYKLLANNLQSNLGTFTEHIYASNQDGSVVIGSSTVFNGETFGIIRPLPLSSTKMALDPDDETLYIYDTNSSKLVIFKIN